MKYLASCSFGKDSIASIIVRLQHGEPIDEVIYCKIMYSDTISGELPEHEKWIHEVAIPKLEKEWGLKTTIVQSKETYLDIFYRKKIKGSRAGQIYGFPVLISGWCTSTLKTRVIKKYEKTFGEYKTITGIAVDETKRVKGAIKRGEILPLVDYNITEAEAFDICKEHGLLSPAYNGGATKLGCWFCHNQNLNALRNLRKTYPELWAELLKIEKDGHYTFKPSSTVAELDKRFNEEEKQETMELLKGDKQ